MSTTLPQLDSDTIDRWMKSLVACTKENAIVVLTPEGTLVGWLGAAEAIFGFTALEAVGMPLSRLFTPEDLAAGLEVQERELTLAAGRSEDDRWHMRKDGSRFWGSGVMEQIVEDDRVVALAKVLRDRTDVRTQIVALQNRLSAAEEQNARRLEALTSLAHELRNQVSPLANLVTVIEKTGDSSAVLPTMRHQVDILSRLLNDLTEQAAVVSATATLTLADVEVQAALHHCANAISAETTRRGQTLKMTLPDVPISIQADAHRLDQMLFNLASNASKFTPAGGNIQLSATVEDDMVAIRVEDDGDGIPADVLPKIFELFTREVRADAPAGLGVGLAVVKTLAQLHGGFVEGRSPGAGKGSIFTIRLPLVQPSTPRMTADSLQSH